MKNDLLDIKRGDVFIFNLTGKQGSVQQGERPCVVISNNSNNKYAEIVIVVPITSQFKHKIPTHVNINLGYMSTIMCEQPQTISKDNLYKRIGHINNMQKIDKAIKVAQGLVIY